MRLRHVVLDFDGTCTRVEDAADSYLDECRRIFAEEVSQRAAEEWTNTLSLVKSRSPRAGWMLGGTPSAPAAADPYILASEAAEYLVKKHKITKPLPPDLHLRAYEVAQAPFREETAHVLAGLVEHGVAVHFVSNSRTRKIEYRLDDLLGRYTDVRKSVKVEGAAGKFRIQELCFDAPLSEDLRKAFDTLPAARTAERLDRPVYLRRGMYFEALSRVWQNDPSALGSTLVCGDVWELDLAMPAELGAEVHLITRASPYDTYDYERLAVQRLGARGGISDDLHALLERVRKARST